MLFLLTMVLVLLAGSFYTYVQDRKLQSVSLSALLMASWNLTQLGREAASFDRELALIIAGAGDADELTLRYDILWSRYDYLLHSKESRPTRKHNDNKIRLEALFAAFKNLETPLLHQLERPESDLSAVVDAWGRQYTEITQLLTDNFVGDESSQIMTSIESSRNRLANLRLFTLATLAAVFGYMSMAVAVVRRRSRIDPVTGLPNASRLKTLHNIDNRTTIIILSICNLRLVLSDFGNDVANELQCLVANRLKQIMGPDDELIHISPGEFLLLMSDLPPELIKEITSEVVAETTFDWAKSNSVLHASAVLGVEPPCDQDCRDWHTRYQQAHRALVLASTEGHSYYINDDTLRQRLDNERQIHAGLLNFFTNEPGSLRLHLVYQPIVLSADRHLVRGAEVLLRCYHDSLGFIPPNQVVDLSERFGLGLELGRWLFRQIARETAQLYQNLGFRGKLSINLNPAMLTDQLVKDVRSLLLDQGIPATSVCLEITEDNAALDFTTINHLIRELHDMGIGFALDDFGTGHSSLEYVRELKIDRLKIDRCFVDGIELNKDKARFLSSIIAMAQGAYIETVVEGVENEQQWQLIQDFGEILIQGYHAHKPMPFNDYIALLLDSNTRYPTAAPRSALARY